MKTTHYSIIIIIGLLLLVPSVEALTVHYKPTNNTGGSGNSTDWNDLINIPAGFADNIDNEGAGSTDGNNYTIACSVSGTTTKSVTCSRNGMTNLSYTFNDIDTNDGTGGWTNTSTVTSTSLNVGINNNTPTGPFEAHVDIDTYMKLESSDNGIFDVAGAAPSIYLRVGEDTTKQLRLHNSAGNSYVDYHGGALLFRNDGGTTSMTIENSNSVNIGNGYNFTADTASTFIVDGANNRVGIGTSEPNVALDVNGSSKIAGNLSVNGIVNTTNITIDKGKIVVTNVASGTGLSLSGTAPAVLFGASGAAVGYATSTNNFVSGSIAGDVIIRSDPGKSVIFGNTSAAYVAFKPDGYVDFNYNTLSRTAIFPSTYDNRKGLNYVPFINEFFSLGTTRGLFNITSNRAAGTNGLTSMVDVNHNTYASWTGVNNTNPVAILLNFTELGGTTQYVGQLAIIYGFRNGMGINYTIKTYEDNANDGTPQWTTIKTFVNASEYAVVIPINYWRVYAIELNYTAGGDSDKTQQLYIASIEGYSAAGNGLATGGLPTIGTNTFYGNQVIKATANNTDVLSIKNSVNQAIIDFSAGTDGDGYIELKNASGVVHTRLYSEGDSYFNGSLMIGSTSTPNQRLHVTGNANITGTVYANGYAVCQSDGTNCPTSGSADINGSDAWLNTLNVTTLNANVEDGGVNFSHVLNAQGLELLDTDGRFVSVHPWGIETGGQIAGGTLSISDNSFDYFASYTLDGIGYSGFNTGGYDNYLFYVEGSNGANPGHPTFSVDSRTNTTTAERLHVNTTLNVTTEIYVGNAVVCRSDGTNCPAGSGDNSSWNQSGYWINASGSFYPLKTNPAGFYNSSTIPAYVLISSLSGAVGQNLTYALINTNMGNWSADKASYATNAHVANVNSTALKNASDAYFGTLNSTKNITAGEDLILLDDDNAVYFGTDKCLWMNGTNTGVGCLAGPQNMSATGTTLLGDQAGASITSGSNNVAIGYGAMIAGKTSADNVALGTFSLFRTVDGGNYNFALGRSSGASITTGDSNICIGFSACQNTGNKGNQYNITDGGQNIFIGTLAGPGDLGGNAQNRVAIGYQAECNRNDSVCLGMATTRQNVGINTDRPENTLDVNGTLAVNGVHVTGSWTNYTTIKQNVFGTTLANITGLAWGAAANTNYTFDCSLLYQSNLTTNGISFAMEDWGGTVTWFEITTEIHTVAAATVNSATANTTGTKMTSTAVTAANTKYRASIDGIIINGASAVTITPQFSAEIAGSNSSIMRGSHCDVKVI